MAALVIYPHPCDKTGTRFKVVKGRLNGKRNHWIITVWFDVPEELLDLMGKRRETNPRSITFSTKEPCLAGELLGPIEQQLEAEQAIAGTVRWRAIQER